MERNWKGTGLAGLCACLWSMKNGQLEDLDGAGERVLHQPLDAPLPADRDDDRKQ